MVLFLQVKIWFQNHRYKCKRASRERQSAQSQNDSDKSGDARVKSESKDPETDSLVDPNESDVAGSPLNEDDFAQEVVKNSLLNYSAAHAQQQTAVVQPGAYPNPAQLQTNPVAALNDMTRCPGLQPALTANPGAYATDANNLALFQNTLGARW